MQGFRNKIMSTGDKIVRMRNKKMSIKDKVLSTTNFKKIQYYEQKR